jgi:prepilin-type N-terminal cleavage/methylation domain-containing protein
MKIENCKLKIAKRKGFTLIEMLVVIFVLGVGLIGALSFFSINLNNQFEAKNELIAAGLAQETSDLVRNIVDYNYLNPEDAGTWYNEIYNNINKKYCSSIDRDNIIDSSTRFKCTSNVKSEVVCFDGSHYFQAKNGNCLTAVKTIFRRELVINLSEIGADLDKGGCLKVEVTVGWPTSDSDCADNLDDCPKKTISTDIICKPRQ